MQTRMWTRCMLCDGRHSVKVYRAKVFAFAFKCALDMCWAQLVLSSFQLTKRNYSNTDPNVEVHRRISETTMPIDSGAAFFGGGHLLKLSRMGLCTIKNYCHAENSFGRCENQSSWINAGGTFNAMHLQLVHVCISYMAINRRHILNGKAKAKNNCKMDFQWTKYRSFRLYLVNLYMV